MPLEVSPGDSFEVPGNNLEIGGGDGGVNIPDNSGDLEVSPPSGFEVPGAKIIVNLPTPMFQAVGGQVYKLLLETIASQVKMSDGVSVETRLVTLERALAANTKMYFADDIAARDKLSGLIPGDKVHVKDATGDETVEKGWAEYIYQPDLTFHKIAEGESLDVVLNWNDIIGKPESEPTQIDAAVLQQHHHANKTELDQLSDDGADHLLYKGLRVNDGKAWVKMAASVEAVDKAELAEGALVIVNPALGTNAPAGAE